MTDLVVDVPAYSVDDEAHAIFGSDNLSTPDTATELVLDQVAQPLLVGSYGTPGSDNINMPATPAGYTLTAATYVVIARAEASEAGDPTDWSPDTPDPTQFPFLMVETSATSYQWTLDPIPVGAYAGETVWPGNDLSLVLADLPSNRLWLQSYAPVAIHVAYLAVRLTYTPDTPDVLPPLRLYPRDDDQAAAPVSRNYPHTKSELPRNYTQYPG